MKSLKNTSRKLRLRTALVVPFILQIVAAVGLVGYLSFRSGERAINDLANQLQKEVNNRVNHHLETYLKMPQRVNQINHDIIQIGLLDANNLLPHGSIFGDSFNGLKPSVTLGLVMSRKNLSVLND